MALTYSESDTQQFGESCVSNFITGTPIHKSTGFDSFFRAGTVKNVYETQRTDDPYTTGLAFAARQA